MTEAFLGLDLGATEVKAGLVDRDGHLLAIGRAATASRSAHGPGWAEQDPGAWWSAVVSAVRALRPADPVEVVAIGVDGHGPTLAAVDARGEATRPAITFLDTRSADRGGGAGGRDRPTRLGAGSAARRPLGRASRAGGGRRHALVPHDLGVARVSADRGGGRAGRPAPGRAGRGRRGDGDRAPCDRRPAASAMGAVVGQLTETAADALGLSAGIPVAGGTNDAFASYLGAGLLQPGDAYDPGGSAGGFGVYWDRPVEVPGAFVTPAPLVGLYSVGAAMAATGRAVDWFRDAIVGQGMTTERLLDEAMATPPGADGLVFLPYLAGRTVADLGSDRDGGVRRPDPGPRPRPSRACHRRGSALAIRHVATPCSTAGVRVTAMRACGGPGPQRRLEPGQGRRHRVPVLVPAVLETAVLGSAMLGAVGSGTARTCRPRSGR